MGKTKIGSMKQKILVQGDINLLEPNEILVTQSEGYTILRERLAGGQIKTSVIVPLEEFMASKEEPERNTKPAAKSNTERAAEKIYNVEQS